MFMVGVAGSRPGDRIREAITAGWGRGARPYHIQDGETLAVEPNQTVDAGGEDIRELWSIARGEGIGEVAIYGADIGRIGKFLAAC